MDEAEVEVAEAPDEPEEPEVAEGLTLEIWTDDIGSPDVAHALLYSVRMRSVMENYERMKEHLWKGVMMKIARMGWE